MIPTDILNYRIVRLLGSGGMGSVYLAVNTNIDQQVAIKVIRPEMAKNPAFRARFKQEAELLCSLDHPNIVKFLNYVETPEGVFLIMEYVKGITLEDYINKKNGLIVESKAYPMIKEILDAFAYAHSKGIIHRDIKPSNIFIQDDGHVKIMDFGIAQIVSETKNTGEGRTMGTPAYMSPEQIYGKEIDQRSDIYSLGVLIHHMLTGRAPYDSTKLTPQEIKRKVVKDPMPKMIEYYPYVSDKIQKVVDKATEKVPEARYGSCDDMREAVKKAIAPDPIPKGLIYGSIAAIVVMIVVGFLVWDHYRTKIEYYADYVEVYGMPKGVGKVSKGDMSHREGTYRFESSKGKVRRVTYLNSKGNPISHHDSEHIDRIVDVTLTYAEGTGKVDTEIFRNQSGRVLYVKDFDSNMKTCTFKLDDELGTEMTLNSQVSLFESAFDSNKEGKSRISKYILDFDKNGYLIRERYAGFGNILVPDGQGIFGKEYKHDKHGRVIEVAFLGKNGQPKATSFGLGKKRFTYDDEGNMMRIDYLTVDDKPSSDGNNCPVVLLTYDKYGNRQSERYFSADMQPTLRKDNLVAGYLYEYNDEGQPTKFLFLGLDGRLTYSNGAAGFIDEYDERGYLSRRTFIDADGNGALWRDTANESNYFQIEIKNDEQGNVVDQSFLNLDGQLIDTPYYARRQCAYDSVGNLLSEFYLNEEGEICVPPLYGYAGVMVDYNPQGRIERVTYLDANKNRITLPDLHLCYVVKEYDARGNISKVSYYDDKDQLATTNEGISYAVYEYDDNGNESARSFFDKNGKPCVLNNYCARVEYEYDEQGNTISQTHKNVSGNMMLVGGVARYEREYNDRGNVTRERPMGTNGKLAVRKLDTRMKYDDLDNLIEMTYYDDLGHPAEEIDEGYHKVTNKYDSNNLRIETTYYGKDGKLKNLKGSQYAVQKNEYDERGNNISVIFFNHNGERGSDELNVHKYFNQFDKVTNLRNHQISFGIDGKPIVSNGIAPEGRVEYDKRGNTTKIICYDGYGKPINGEQGWHSMRCVYDASDLNTEIMYFSVDGKPLRPAGLGYHKKVNTFNSMRMLESESYYDEAGKKVILPKGYHKIKYKYNSQNQRTEIAYYGLDDRPVDNQAGWHKEVYQYKVGNVYKCIMYDRNNKKLGEATMGNNGWQMHESNNIMATEWKELWKGLASMCPMNVSVGIQLSKVTLNNNSVNVTLRLDTDKLALSEEEMEEAIKEMSKYLRKETKTPSYIDIKIEIITNSTKEIMLN